MSIKNLSMRWPRRIATLVRALKNHELSNRKAAQWCLFLRITMSWIPAPQREQREQCSSASGPTRLCSSIARHPRRLAPMLNGDRRIIELAYSLFFTLPGTPVTAMAMRSAWAMT